MRLFLWPALLALTALTALPALAANETPEQCFAQAKLIPADQQEGFLKACLADKGGAAPSTVSPEQRAKVCATIAEREKFQGEQLVSFLKGCKGG